MPFRIFFLLIFLAIAHFACNNDQVITPDIANENVEFNVVEFDKMLFEFDASDLASSIQNLKSEHPLFIELFFESILPLKTNTGEIDHKAIEDFISDPFLINLKDTIGQLIDKRQLSDELQTAFKYAKHYFPNWGTPNIYTLISDFAYQRFLFEDEEGEAIGIGLDFFLGKDYPYKQLDPKNPSFSAYQTRSFNKDHIVKKTLEVWVEDKIPPATTNNLVAHMVTNGKKLYVLDKLLPHVSDTIIMEYSASQLKWAQESELQIWSFFFDQKLFYETNLRKINKYINPSPNSPGMPDVAPGRIANYMGWKIVEAYMDKNPSISIEMLILDRDAQRILDLSKYKPKKK